MDKHDPYVQASQKVSSGSASEAKISKEWQTTHRKHYNTHGLVWTPPVATEALSARQADIVRFFSTIAPSTSGVSFVDLYLAGPNKKLHSVQK